MKSLKKKQTKTVNPGNVNQEIASAGTVALAKGFIPGLSQPGDMVLFDLPRNKGMDIAQLDALLVEIFGTDLAPCKADGAVSAQHPDVQLAWRVMLVARDLAQACGLPVFDPGKILSVTNSPTNTATNRVRCLFSMVDQVPPWLFQQVYVHAKGVIGEVSRPLPRSELDSILEKIHREFLRPARATLRCGESTIAVLRSAYDRRIPFRHVGHSVYRLGWGSRARLVDKSAMETDAAIGARMSKNKLSASQLLRGAGLPASRHVPVKSEQSALEAARQLGWPVVVKPADRDRGEGITVNVSAPETLLAAYRYASQSSQFILIEQQAPGVCHRIFVAAQKKILFVTKRLPKGVKGDGVRTVGELIAAANEAEAKKAPWRRLKPFPTDALALRSLAEAGFTLESVPATEELAPLRPIQSSAEGGVSESRTDDIHPDNVDIALRAAALFGLDSVGVDLISDDISRPWHENGAIINEVNYAPLLGRQQPADGGRDYPGELFDYLFHHCGRLPVHVYVGGEGAAKAAASCQQVLVSDGVQCYLASHLTTLRPDGSAITSGPPSLFNRTLHLTADRHVEAMVLVVQTDEWLFTGLPVDSLAAVHVVEREVTAWQNPGNAAPATGFARLLRLLESFSK